MPKARITIPLPKSQLLTGTIVEVMANNYHDPETGRMRIMDNSGRILLVPYSHLEVIHESSTQG